MPALPSSPASSGIRRGFAVVRGHAQGSVMGRRLIHIQDGERVGGSRHPGRHLPKGTFWREHLELNGKPEQCQKLPASGIS